MRSFKNIVMLGLLILTGCSTQSKSAALGGGIGAGTGMVVGAIADPNADGGIRTRNVIIGGALGGIAGGIIGQEIHKGQAKARAEGLKDGARSPAGPAGKVPILIPAKYEAHWIEPKPLGNRYIDGHYEYIITEQAKFEGVQ